jgi:hypothetical protein
MSIQKVSSIPNVYKLEKFVIIDTLDTFKVSPLEVTKPNLLECYKVYVDVEYDGKGGTVKTEKVNTDKPILVAVPLNLWQQGSRQGLDNSGNSLICPPYVATEMGKIKPDITLADNITGSNIHRGSVIYAQRRDYGVDIYGSDGSTRQGESVGYDDLLNKTKYIDVNVDGRSLKTTSQTDKSNNVALTTDQFAPRHGGPPEGTLTNYFTGDPSRTHIESLQKACIINEDGAIDYITELDKVEAKWKIGSTTHTKPQDAGDIFGLVFSISGNSGSDYPVARFEKVTSSNGTPTSFKALGDTPDTFNNAQKQLIHVGVDGEGGPDDLEFTHLINNHLDDYVENDAETTPYFAVCAANSSLATEDKYIRLKTLAQLRSETTTGLGDINTFTTEEDASLDKQFVLSVSDTGTATFRNIKYLSQFGGVSIKDGFFNVSNPEATTCHAVLTKVPNSDTNFSVKFEKIGDLLDTTGGTIDDKEDLSAWYVVQSGGSGGKLKAASLDKSLFSGSGDPVDGTVRYVKATRTLQLKDAGFGTKEGGDVDKSLNYTPTLFGICKEDGSYEYRYFLTSAAVTAT